MFLGWRQEFYFLLRLEEIKIKDFVNQAAAMISILFKIWRIKLLQWYQSYSWFGESSCCNDINPIQDLVYQAAAMISILFMIWCIKLLQWYQSYSRFGLSSCCNDINPIQDLVYQAAAMISILCKQDFFVDIHKKISNYKKLQKLASSFTNGLKTILLQN